MIFYVKYDPISKSIDDYTNIYDDEKHITYLKIDINRDYGDDIAYINQNFNINRKNRRLAISISVMEIKKLLIEKIRDDKLKYLIN